MQGPSKKSKQHASCSWLCIRARGWHGPAAAHRQGGQRSASARCGSCGWIPEAAKVPCARLSHLRSHPQSQAPRLPQGCRRRKPPPSWSGGRLWTGPAACEQPTPAAWRAPPQLDVFVTGGCAWTAIAWGLQGGPFPVCPAQASKRHVCPCRNFSQPADGNLGARLTSQPPSRSTHTCTAPGRGTIICFQVLMWSARNLIYAALEAAHRIQ